MTEGGDGDDAISLQLSKARELLARAKAKLDTSEGVSATVDIALTSDGDIIKEKKTALEQEEDGPLPFFAKASEADKALRRNSLTKTSDETTGLKTFDGEKMASISASEKWESRPLLDVFEEEVDEERRKTMSSTNAALDQRDVGASIYNLRKKLQNSDFEKIFNKRNYFIGEE